MSTEPLPEPRASRVTDAGIAAPPTVPGGVLLEYSSAALAGPDPRGLVARAVATCASYGFTFGVQVHNAAPPELVQLAAGLGVPLSVHAPILGEHLINLAAQDPTPGLASLATTLAWMREQHATVAVFHGFVMTDLPIPTFNPDRPYQECFARVWRPELSLADSTLCADFTGSAEYARRFALVQTRFAALREAHPDLILAIENDFPCFGSGLFFADQAVALASPLCLDTGHLWAAAHLFGRSFHDEAEVMLRSGRVRLVHLHASPWTAATPRLKWADGHRPLATPNTMELPRLVAACRRFGVKHFTLETSAASEDDLHRFAKMWTEAAAP